MIVNKILSYIDSFAPFGSQEEWDNSGLQLGSVYSDVRKVLLSLDVTMAVIEEAIVKDCNLIISHHPLIFHPLSSVQNEVSVGKKIYKLCKNEINVISAHTNLDKALVNEVLIRELGAVSYKKYCDFLYTGTLNESMDLNSFLRYCKKHLNCSGIRYVDAGKDVLHIGCCGGSGGEELYEAAKNGCDTFITADIKHNVWIDALEMGINLIDADHFNTEDLVIPELLYLLQTHFPEIEFSKADSDKKVICYA